MGYQTSEGNNALHRVVVIGVGSIGERHLRCFQSTGRAEVMFVEVQPELRQTISGRYQVPAFERIEQALEQKPTVAVVATPASLHIPHATTLVESGLHTLIEKPLSTTFDGVEQLDQLRRRQGLTVGVAYVYRSFPLLHSVREILEERRFGEPLQWVTVSGQHFPTYRPAYREIYYRDRAMGGGAIQDALTHVLNAGEWLLGPIDRVLADAAHQALEGVDVEDTVHLLARHGRTMASYSLNQHQAPNESTTTLVCERGTIRWELHHQRWMWMTEPGGQWHMETLPALERDAYFVAQANDFLDAVERKREVACSLAEAEQTLRVNLAALRSLETGSWETTYHGTDRPTIV
jgi:predicted dehydrogenase